MADNWYDSVELPGGGDPGAQYKRNGAQEVVTNIVYVQGGWVTVPTTTDLNDLNVQRLYEGQVIYVSQSHELYITKKFQPGEYTVDDELQYAMSRSFHPLDFPHEGFNASSGSLPTSLGHLSSSNVFSSSGQFTGTNLTFTGEVTMSNLEIGGHLETNTLSFDGVNFITSTINFTDGSTVFGANASGALDPASPQAEDVEPSDLNHKFTGSLLITGGLVINDIDYKTFATSTTVTSSINAAIAVVQANVDAVSVANNSMVSQSALDAISVANNSMVSQSALDAISVINPSMASSSLVTASINTAIAAISVANNSMVSQSALDAISVINPSMASSSLVTASINTAVAAVSVANNAMASSSLVTASINTALDNSHNPNYVSSSEVTTNITELSYDSLIVSDVDIPLTNTNAFPTITNGIVIGGNTTDGQYNFNVQTNITDAWPDVSTHIEGGISTIVNTVDNSDETATRYNHQSEDFNFVFDLGSSKTVSEFRITFAKQDSEYELPENIFIYGKTESFSAGEDDGILLGEGARPGAGGVGVNWSGPSSNPLSLYGIGDQGNLNRTASIAETSLTSSFQYYRVRFQKSIIQEDGRNRPTFTKIANITPVIRNTSTGTSISASNGVLNVNTITTNNLIGTASFANFATTANEAFSSSYALTASYIEGATSIELSSITTDITPDGSDIHSLGTPNLKWKDVYAINTFFGGIHEINLKTEGLDQMQEGTVLSLQNGTLYPCKKEADPLVMGIVSKGENFPIILGAEPVLVTGKVEEGDYIITSNVKGHGKGINPQHIYDKQLFGKIIAQAIEKGEGESYTIKAMIRKM